MTDLRLKPGTDEVRNAYRLFLGREAENEHVVGQLAEGADEGWLYGFLASDEFANGTARAILHGTALPHLALAPAPSPKLRAWAEHRLSLTPAGRDKATEAESWAAILLAVLDDAGFRHHVLGDRPHPVTPDLVAALRAQAEGSAATVTGAVDRLLADEIRGWAIDAVDPNRELVVELRIDGRFVAAAPANAMHRDLQERFGSHGRHGFTLRYSQVDNAAGATGLLVEQASGLVIAEVQIPARRHPPLDLLASLRRELGEMHRMLGRIEGFLPEFHGHFTYGLSSYGEYFETYYRGEADGDPVGDAAADLAVILIGVTATPGDLARSLAAIGRQRCCPGEVIVLHADGVHGDGERSAIANARALMPGMARVEGRPCDPIDWSTGLNALVADIRLSNILLLRASGVLAADAVEVFAAALAAGAVLAYADEDGVDLTPDGREQRHHDPVFRTGFDRDLLQQVDCVGDVVAMRRDLAARIGFAAHPGPATLFDFLLRIEPGDRAAIIHLPRILFHRIRRGGGVPARDRLVIVAQQLIADGGSARAELLDDSIGAQPTGALRLRYPVPPGAKAAIIIPTRDRLDLLGPCLAGISNAARTSSTELEVIVVDNASEQAATHAVLATLEAAGSLRVLRFDGVFNWSLMNNQAAATTDADVLIFLNNDTIGIGRSCWDELVAQALRSDVGAVGARLLYEDGTIQHAGMVVGGWPGFVEHEGMGDAGSFPGYLGRHSLLRQVSAVTGACLATRADLFRTVGGFDETMPVQGNDADYCFKVRAAGFDVRYDPYATLYHFESKSRGYDHTEEKRREAGVITERLRERWEDRFGRDPFYNGHFDRLAPAMTKLRPPPKL